MSQIRFYLDENVPTEIALRLAAEGMEHAGIAFSPQDRVSIGGWVRHLRALHARYESGQVKNQVLFLSL